MAGEAMSAYVRFFVRDEVSSEARNVERNAQRAADGMDEAANAAGNNLAGGFEKAKGKAATFAKGLAGVAGAATAFLGGVAGLATSTADFQEDMGKLQTAFETQGHSMETAKSTYNDFVGLLGETDQSVEAANHLAELTSNTQELAAWGDIGAGVYAKFGDSLPLEGLTEAANHTAKLGEVQGPLADALEWTGTSAEEFNKQLAACNSEEERASLITETLNGIYGEAGAAYQANNANLIAQRQAQSDFNMAMAEMGETIRPLFTSIMQFATGLMASLQPAVKWFVDNLPTIAPIVAGIVTAFLAFHGISAAVAAVTAVMTLFRNGLTLTAIAQGVLNRVMQMNPFILVASLIAGLVVAIVGLWNTNEGFRNAVMNAWNGIKSTVGGVVSSVGGFIGGLVSTISGAFNSIKSTATNIWNGIKNAIMNPIKTAQNFIKNAINKIKGFFNVKLSFPKIKLPHFKISGGEVPWGIGGVGTAPKIGIDWYAKGGVFNRATLLPTSGGGLAGVGEAGKEAVAPIDVLMGYVRQAVAEAQGGGYVANINVTTGETSEAKLAKLIARENKRLAYNLGAL